MYMPLVAKTLTGDANASANANASECLVGNFIAAPPEGIKQLLLIIERLNHQGACPVRPMSGELRLNQT